MGLKELTEKYLGTIIPSEEWNEARSSAERKLERIINREGDAGGERQETWYLAQLIAEAVRESRFSRYTIELMQTMTTIEAKKEKPAAGATSNSITNASIVAELI